MMRVNLLPPEILERRRAEKRVGLVIVAAIGVAIVLAGVWGFSYFRLQAKQDELAALQQQVQATNAQATQLAIFEQRASELKARQETVVQALGNRRDWAKLYDEMSLVLPTDMWLLTMNAAEDNGLTLAGFAVDAPNDSPDAGHKAIAKALVRLADLDSVYDVWLTSSAKTTVAEKPAIQFTITAKVVDPATVQATTTGAK
jgi:Tfp pilus assembly protein PilN